MADKKEIKFSIPKEKALKIAKKAASSKFAIMKDSGFVFKVGAPMMTATVEVEDGVIYVSGASTVAPTVFNTISDAIEEEENAGGKSDQHQVAPANASQGTFADDQFKVAFAIKTFGELQEKGIITEEEFKKKLDLLLKFATSSEEEYEKKAPSQDSPATSNAPTEKLIVDSEKRVEIMRKCLNMLFANGKNAAADILIIASNYQDSEISKFAVDIDNAENNNEAIDIAKEYIKRNLNN